MRTLMLVSFLMLLIITSACTTTGDNLTSPAVPESAQSLDNFDQDDYTSQCRANMRTIATQCVIFLANNGYYPNSLEEIGMTGVVCEECGLPYEITGDEKTFFIQCPMPCLPNHGNIDNGVPSWVTEPPQGQDACRANMRTIVSQCVIFFAGNNRYPESLEEIGMEDAVCSDCGLPYLYRGDETSFSVECPLPCFPNHGSIIDGIVSW